jgi:Predicted endonuclease containing a URI domain
MKSFFVYILASKRNGTLYIGVTNDLRRRIEEHRSGAVEGFTKKYGIKTLVYFEQTDSAEAAIAREKTAQELETRVEDRTYTKRTTPSGAI